MEHKIQNRDKELKFKEIAEMRVNNAIEKIRLIKKLANRSHYSYTPEQVKKIKKALDAEIEDLVTTFGGGQTKKEFKLD